MKVFEPLVLKNGLTVSVKEMTDFEDELHNLKALLPPSFDLINLQYLNYKVLNGLIEVAVAIKILRICKKYAMYSNFYDKIQTVLSETNPMRVEIIRRQLGEWLAIWRCS
jgi:hypothetical protein